MIIIDEEERFVSSLRFTDFPIVSVHCYCYCYCFIHTFLQACIAVWKWSWLLWWRNNQSISWCSVHLARFVFHFVEILLFEFVRNPSPIMPIVIIYHYSHSPYIETVLMCRFFPHSFKFTIYSRVDKNMMIKGNFCENWNLMVIHRNFNCFIHN